MRTASLGLIADVALEVTTLARLWRVTRRDGEVLRFTDAVRPIVHGGFTYRADITFTCSSIFTSSTFARAQNVTMRFMLSEDGIDEADMRARLWDKAVAEVMLINYEDTSHGVMTLFKGNFGRLKLSDQNVAEVEMIPAGAAGADASIGAEVYSATCRNSLGDSNCQVDLEALKVAFTVDSITGNTVVASEFTAVDNYFAQGFIKWSTGDNEGQTSLVMTSDQSSTNAILSALPTKAIVAGDTGFIYPGCDKLPATCRDKFANLLHNRSEPNVPGIDILPDNV